MSASLKTKSLHLTPVRLWDLPTRLSHWALVLFVSLSWWSAENALNDVHVLSGYAVLTLALVSFYWEFFGSATARFGHFVRGPRATWTYTRQTLHQPGIISAGHNPLGALIVMVLLGFLLVQPALGLLAKDIDGLHSGPLTHFVSFGTGRIITGLHHLIFELLLIFIVLHLAAVTFYVLYKRDGIISAMISGYKQMSYEFRRDFFFVPALRAALALGAVIVLMITLHYLGSAL